MENKNQTISNILEWVSSSVMLKLAIILILTVLLLLPQIMIQELIVERQSLNQDAIQEVSDKWGNAQTIGGPILTIPVTCKDPNKENEVVNSFYHLLPESLQIKGELQPQSLQRGIYRIIVYESNVAISGSFVIPPHLDIPRLLEIHWDQAFLSLGISDLRGVKEDVTFNWSNQNLEAIPGSRIPQLLASAITFPLKLPPENASATFSTQVVLNGSESLQFLPTGKITNVEFNSPWSSVKFTGATLPAEREVGKNGFTSSWKILQLNRNYPQTWLDDEYAGALLASSSGVELIQSLDEYQKSMRSVKYGLLTIVLTFLTFFLVEVRFRRKIHPFQYTLVGLALVLFYILLLSLSEHIAFNIAYFISTVVVSSMIYLYSRTVFKTAKFSLVLLAILLAVYGFLFVILQLSDYALIMGSIGLTVILAITMYQTRNIQWYQ